MRAARLIDLVVKDDGVYHNDGSGEYKIDVLYRLHPLELLMDDESDDGYPVGLKLMDLANMHKVILVNPVKAILMQNKAMMVIAHYLAGSTGYLTMPPSRLCARILRKLRWTLRICRPQIP